MIDDIAAQFLLASSGYDSNLIIDKTIESCRKMVIPPKRIARRSVTIVRGFTAYGTWLRTLFLTQMLARHCRQIRKDAKMITLFETAGQLCYIAFWLNSERSYLGKDESRMNFYSCHLSDVVKELSACTERGLTAGQAAERLKRYGVNELDEKAPRTLFQRVIDQMRDLMIIILLVAATVSCVLATYEAWHGQEANWTEPIVIIIIVLLNAALGVFQESKAEAALAALKNMTKPNARVHRDGSDIMIPSGELVPGDLLLLAAGDIIPADARIVESAALKSDESALTGESVPVEKRADVEIATDAPLGDRLNMVYSGSFVSYGRATALVVATGMSTEMGKIASLLESEEGRNTPLQEKLTQLGKYLALAALTICAVIFILGIMVGTPLVQMFMTAISLAVAAIPEGLPAIVTIVMAIGVQRMVARHAIIRRLLAVETLGSTSVICSDKTGTLTQNRMTLVKVFAGGKIVPLEESSVAVKELVKYGAICTDGAVEIVDGVEKHTGDPTETAIVAAALRMGMDKAALARDYKRLAEIPFDSERKLMTTINEVDGRVVAIVKGAPDNLFERCAYGDIEAACDANEEMSSEALRVLAVACRELDYFPAQLEMERIESELTLLGLVGIIDPPRQEIPSAIKECVDAGILTVMITGDHVTTAAAIAKELGILWGGARAVTGGELATMSDDELQRDIENYRVYARVSPSDKIRVVKAWQSKGHVVAMTGDGVNDAPALKAADIGCAMGITGTDVAKGAADMILTDDNFATIVTAIRDGRGIYDNIRKSIQFLLSCNIGEIITVFFAMLLWKELPLLPIQLLWINLVTDSLPALALGVEPVEHDIMKRRPRDKKESIFAGRVGIDTVWQGVMIGALTLMAYYLGSRTDINGAGHVLGSTMAFTVLAMSQLVHALNVRSSHSLFRIGLTGNRHMVGAIFASLVLMLSVLLIPRLRAVFGVIEMNGTTWLIIVGLSLLPLILCEMVKLLTDRGNKS